jgi:molybdopterin molybdotransferase
MSFHEARACVIARVRAAEVRPQIDEVALEAAAGRVLAEEIAADRDYPQAARSIRDGFAVRAADLPGRLRVIGEVRAGEAFLGEVGRGQAVEVMTGAPLPRGADAVVMVEHVERAGDSIHAGAAEPGQFVNPQGSEARKGARVLAAGARLGFAEIALLAAVGKTRLRAYRKPRVAILVTGDELVEPGEQPLEHQIRNSNGHSLAVQVRRAGGLPEVLPVAKDSHTATRALIERGMGHDLLLLSGGVSAGKYDVVEPVLGDLGAEFFFDRVLIQPGQPTVFGRLGKLFFFGLPGNPVSTMVTFELFARAALELLEGQSETVLRMALARLTTEFRHRPGLTRFLPARLSSESAELTPIPWQGSSDVPALARANAWLVAEADRESWQAGELMRVLLR